MTLPIVAVDYVAVIAAAVVSFVIGFLWYGPLFGKTWMKLMNFSKDANMKKGMAGKMVAHFIANIILTFVLAHVLAWTQAATIASAAGAAFLVWLGFFATTALGQVLWEGKSTKLYVLNVVYSLITLVVASAILVSL